MDGRPGLPVALQALNRLGIGRAPDAALAVVTPGQQAPLGVPLLARRRQALLDWAASSRAWIIEDDYISELQLKGRAPPSLGAIDRQGRVLHICSVSKTLTPALQLGFLVAAPGEAERFARQVAVIFSAPAPLAQ